MCAANRSLFETVGRAVGRSQKNRMCTDSCFFQKTKKSVESLVAFLIVSVTFVGGSI